MVNSKENLSRFKKLANDIVKNEGSFLEEPFEELLINNKVNDYIYELMKILADRVDKETPLSEDQPSKNSFASKSQRMVYEEVIRSAIADERTRIYVDKVLMRRRENYGEGFSPSNLTAWLIDGDGASTSALFTNSNEVKYLSSEFDTAVRSHEELSKAIRGDGGLTHEETGAVLAFEQLSKGIRRDGNLTYKDAGAILAFSPFLRLEEVKRNEASSELCEKLKNLISPGVSDLLDKMASALDFAAIDSHKFPFVYRSVEGYTINEMVPDLKRWDYLEEKHTKVVGLTEKESAQLIGDLHKLGDMYADFGLNSKGELRYRGIALLSVQLPRYKKMPPEIDKESSFNLVKKVWEEVSDDFFDDKKVEQKNVNVSGWKLPLQGSTGRTLNLDKFTPSGTQATKDNVENISNKKPGRSE